ncbi:penicillin-binding protein 2 [Azohydromonas aeria]|uniref:penicillin-binding protein 2 n=1 Tax=Azohydromonas aeria TaxID=2590212 RepID=UPI0012F75E19|nr:penicillin-binding protein 2 [Azohydromonas aeria]
MTELRNLERELHRFRSRVLAAAAFVLVGFALLGARLFHLQVVQHEKLSARAEANRIAVLPSVPNRGLIVDRNGVVLATNYSAYTLEITPSKLEQPLERVIEQLTELVEVTPRDRRRFKRLQEESKSFDSLPIRNRLTDAEVARFTAQRFRFPGVEVKARLFRQYPLGETGSHLIGYMGRINQAEKKAMEDWDEELQANYRGTDYIGKLGVEQSYETVLHGTTGFEEVETSAGGRAVRRLRTHPPTPGNTVVLSVDIRLQALVEELFGDRRGALVAMDPRNGEILAFVSKPTFDPNLFVDGIDVENWRELNESIDKPLLNRALRGTYPPGSTFKPFMAMAALTSGKRSAGTVIHDGGSFQFGNHTFRSHGDHGLGAVDMHRSIVMSSNVYYYSLANEMGVDLMHDQLEPFGFGRRTGIDIQGEATGLLPSTEWKRRAYKRPEQKKWFAGETISLGIGQGYNNFTMLQLSNAMSTLLSGGQRPAPHLVREVLDVVSHTRRPVEHASLPPLGLKAEHVEVIKRAMHGVTQGGTSTKVFAGAPYRSGGKTGTAQAVTIRQNERYNAARLAEHQRDHSLYIAFAPLEAPTIALTVIVENAGFGAAAAAPIARRVFDYWLLGNYPSEADIAATRRGESVAPIGAPRRAQDVPLPGNAEVMAGFAPPQSVAQGAGSEEVRR